MATAQIDHSPTLSETLPSDWLAKLLKETAGAYNKKLTEIEALAYLEAWRGLAEKVGRLKFEKALRGAIASCEFLPKLEQIKSRIPAGLKLVGKTDTQCPACDGTGWERVFLGLTIGAEGQKGNPIDPKAGAVRRCSCWRKEERS